MLLNYAAVIHTSTQPSIRQPKSIFTTDRFDASDGAWDFAEHVINDSLIIVLLDVCTMCMYAIVPPSERDRRGRHSTIVATKFHSIIKMYADARASKVFEHTRAHTA